jgi:hypothetical protein
MVFSKRLREGVRRGEITCSVRIWITPRVKVGGRYRMEEGEIEVDSIEPIGLPDITSALAQASGFLGVLDLLKVAKHGKGERIYLVQFHYLPPARATMKRIAQKRGVGAMQSTTESESAVASAKITKRIEDLGDWRGEMLARVRRLIHEADPGIVEEWKWEKPTSSGVPVFSQAGIVCTGESHKQVVKLTFARGASVDDPKKLFNASLEGNVRRAIDLREGAAIDEGAFKQLIRAAVAVNVTVATERKARKK